MTQPPLSPYDHYDKALNAAATLPETDPLDIDLIADDLTAALTSIAHSLLGMLKLSLERL